MQADEDINSLKLLLNNQLKKESSLNCKKLKSGGIHGVDEITFKLFTYLYSTNNYFDFLYD